MFVKNITMAAPKVKLTIAEQIDRAAAGRSQTYLVERMVDAGCEDMTGVKFSRKKLEREGEAFTPEELTVLSKVLGTEITL